MGQEIVYCVTCQTQLRGADFEKQRAFRIDGQPYCLNCSRKVVKAYPPEQITAILKEDEKENISEKRGSRTEQILKIVGTPKSTRRAVRPASPQTLALALGGAFVLLLVVFGIASMSRSAPPVSRSGPSDVSRAPVVEPVPVPPPPVRPPPEALRGPELTPKEARVPAFPELAPLDEELKRCFLKEEYGQALLLIEKARSQKTVPEWNRLMNERTGDVQGRVDETFALLKSKAVAAKRAGDPEEPLRIKERLSKWAIPRLLPELEAALAAVAAPAPSPPVPEVKVPEETPEASLFRSQREKAFELAAARDYAEAAALLERGMTSIRDEKLRAEAAADLDSLRKAASLYAEFLQLLSKWPAGQRIQLSYVDESGKARTIEGTGHSVEPHRIEVRGAEGAANVLLGEIRAAAWTAILKARKPVDARTAALLCLLEGDPATANAPRELEARQAFSSAERKYAQFTSASEAVQGYDALLKDYGNTAFVRRNRLAIAARSRGGREFLFGFLDLTPGGSFASSKNAKGDFVWTSDADTEEARAGDNFIEMAFSVVPDVEYRAWVFVGGCCAETMTFRAEGSDGVAASPVKQNVATGVRRHAGHGGPKQPTRWGWVPVPLPKYSSAGPKILRLCTNQKGFSVATAIVTAVRDAPPRDAEIKELERTRDLNATLIAGLVGWWTFDEGSGTTTADRTGRGNGGTLRGGSTWDVGSAERALKFDGQNEGVSCVPKGFPAANAPQSVAFWFHYETVPASAQVMVALSTKSMSSGVYSGLHFLGGPACRIGTWRSSGPFLVDAAVPPTGKWTHFAYTFDGVRHRLYLNGAGVARSTVEPQAEVPQVLGFGSHSGSNAEAFRGKLDDIRIYSRALSARDVVVLTLNRGGGTLAGPPAAERVVVLQDFNSGRGKFEGGEVTEDASNGVLSCPSKGVQIGLPFGPTVPASAVVRFKVKPPPGLARLSVYMWSRTLNLSCWYHVTGLKAGEWQEVEFKASEIRAGWNRDGATIAGQSGEFLRIGFEETLPDVRLLIDDFEIRD